MKNKMRIVKSGLPILFWLFFTPFVMAINYSFEIHADTVTFNKSVINKGGYTGKSTIECTVPLYKFKDDRFGIFLSMFADSMSVNDRYNILILDTVPRKIAKSIIGLGDTPVNYMFISSESMSNEYIKSVKGSINLSNGEYAILKTDSESWIEGMHIERTDSTVVLRLVTTVEKLDDKTIMLTGAESRLRALLRISPNRYGRVILTYIEQEGVPLKYIEDKKNLFDWIESYFDGSKCQD